MEENKIWRVKFKCGYNELTFDFDGVDEASNFIILAGKTYNKSMTYDKKELYLSMSYVNKTDEEEDES